MLTDRGWPRTLGEVCCIDGTYSTRVYDGALVGGLSSNWTLSASSVVGQTQFRAPRFSAAPSLLPAPPSAAPSLQPAPPSSPLAYCPDNFPTRFLHNWDEDRISRFRDPAVRVLDLPGFLRLRRWAGLGPCSGWTGAPPGPLRRQSPLLLLTASFPFYNNTCKQAPTISRLSSLLGWLYRASSPAPTSHASVAGHRRPHQHHGPLLPPAQLGHVELPVPRELTGAKWRCLPMDQYKSTYRKKPHPRTFSTRRWEVEMLAHGAV